MKYWHRLDRSDVLGKAHGLILDVGAGCNPFEKATHVVDYLERTSYGDLEFLQIDVCNEKLPYKDKMFDFVYCAHTVEDVCNPIFMLREIERVGKAGYFECPSVLQEISAGVDAGNPVWRGHHHHRSFVFFDNGTIHIIPKYPIVEHLDFEEFLPDNDRYWNDWMFWDGSFQVKQYVHNVDYRINDESYKILIDNMSNMFQQKVETEK